jgi:hypothetical protein
MKTERFNTIFTSVVFSAMFALSVVFVGTAVAQPPPKTEPVMTEELMGRMIKRTLASKKPTVMNMKISGIFGINDGKADIPVKQVSETVPEGKHVFVVPLKEGSKDVVLMFARGKVVEVYLTDKTGVLRAAAIFDLAGIRLITNEQAADKYNAELALFAKGAEQLPPTETSPGKNK